MFGPEAVATALAPVAGPVVAAGPVAAAPPAGLAAPPDAAATSNAIAHKVIRRISNSFASRPKRSRCGHARRHAREPCRGATSEPRAEASAGIEPAMRVLQTLRSSTRLQVEKPSKS